MITYNNKKNKTIVCKDGVYLALTSTQIRELINVLIDAEANILTTYKKDSR